MAKAAAAPAAAMKEASLYCPSAAPPVVAAAEAEDAVAEPEVEVLSVPDLVVDEDFVVLASAVPLTVVSEPLAVVVLEAVVVEVLPEAVVEVLSEVVAEAPEVEVLDAPVVQATVLGRSVTPPAEQIALAAFRVSYKSGGAKVSKSMFRARHWYRNVPSCSAVVLTCQRCNRRCRLGNSCCHKYKRHRCHS